MTNIATISLECQWEPSWIDAKTRLTVAAETMEFPFYITTDEAPQATNSLEDYLSQYPAEEHETVTEWFREYTIRVDDLQEALRALYPWFHDGETAPF